MSVRSGFRLGVCLVALAWSPLKAADPLHTRIDQLIDAAAISPFAPTCSDGEFIRRAMLDFLGVIPTSAEARAFIDDPSPNKREALVDRLLADPRHPLHMASTFHVMWMERRPDKHVPTAEWTKFLQDSFRQNKPYDQLVREILAADSANPATRPASKFLLDRDADPHLITRDIGRMFFGVDLQCAQCHDHPLIDDYVQTDYYGLYAFVNRTYLFQDPKENNKGYLAEKADGFVEFKSVFTGNGGKTRPRLLGSFELDEPRFHLGDEYAVAPAQNVRPVPKFSRRELLATALSDGSNVAFRRNIVNRLWAQLMGRGLVHPVDLHHSGNPPSHPEVLDLLAEEIKTVKFDLRAMMRALALTKVYQRAIDLPNSIEPVPNADARLAAWKAEEASFASAADVAKAEHARLLEQLAEASKALAPLEEALSKADGAVVAAKKPYDDAQAALSNAQQEQAAKQSALTAVNEALAKGTEAAKLLPNDAEVTQAVAVFQARAQKLTGEVEAANKAVADQMPAVQASLAKLNEAHQAADAAYAQLMEARKPLDVLKQQIVAAENRQRTDATLAHHRQRRTALLQILTELPARLAAVEHANTAIASAQGEQAGASQAVEVQVAEVAKLTAAMSDAEKVRNAALQQVETAKATHLAKQEVSQTIAEAIFKTETALTKLSDDADLKSALEKLKTRKETLQKDVAALEQAVTARQAEEQAAAVQLKAAQDALTAAQTELAARRQRLEAKNAAIAAAVDAKNAAVAAVTEAQAQLTNGWTAEFAVRDLRPLSPEQFGWSILQACGVIDGYRIATDAEIEKTIPRAGVENDPVQKANRAYQLELTTREKLLQPVSTFATFYGAAPGQPQDDFFATADQALFLANGGLVRGWIVPGTALFDRLNGLTDPKAFAEELYLSVLTRRPSEQEVSEVANFLSAKPNERTTVIQELVWGLLASAEFRFQH
jgi:hypothetical protein